MNLEPTITTRPGTGRLARWEARELRWCLLVNRGTRFRPVEALFAVVSRLGNGVFWFALMLALPACYGTQALPAVGRMLAAGLLGVVLYKLFKSRTARPRPYARHAGFRASVPPLDEFSFPSGHTLHAVGFSMVALAYFPALAWLLIPFTALVAASRVVLGLHYPSDVLAGALTGAALAALVLQF